MAQSKAKQAKMRQAISVAELWKYMDCNKFYKKSIEFTARTYFNKNSWAYQWKFQKKASKRLRFRKYSFDELVPIDIS